MICFTLAATLAVTFVTAAGTALLAGHCGRIAANDPFSAVRTVLEKRAAHEPDETTESELTPDVGSREMPAIAEAEETDEAYLSMLTARIALVLLCAVTAVVTVVFILRRKK